jgi:hypothetical protein
MIGSAESLFLGVVKTTTSCPALDQYFAQEYGRCEAMEFCGGKKVEIIRIRMIFRAKDIEN